MTHLTPGEFIDAIEANAAPLATERQSHLAACVQCQQQLAELSHVLNEAKQTSVPEPSPLFWQHFSQRVRTTIDQPPAPDPIWPAWLRWQVLLPLGAVAMIILALMLAVPKPERNGEELAFESAASPLSPATDSWNAVVEIVGELDLDAASAAGVIEPGVAEQAVMQLTAEEQQELTRLLQAELTRAKS